MYVRYRTREFRNFLYAFDTCARSRSYVQLAGKKARFAMNACVKCGRCGRNVIIRTTTSYVFSEQTAIRYRDRGSDRAVRTTLSRAAESRARSPIVCQEY